MSVKCSTNLKAIQFVCILTHFHTSQEKLSPWIYWNHVSKLSYVTWLRRKISSEKTSNVIPLHIRTNIGIHETEPNLFRKISTDALELESKAVDIKQLIDENRNNEIASGYKNIGLKFNNYFANIGNTNGDFFLIVICSRFTIASLI